MKNILLSFILLASNAALAQTSPLRTHPQADYIRNERVELEKQTELKILEKLEESRLQEERTRMQRVEGTSFSVIDQPQAQQIPQQQYQQSQLQTQQVVPAYNSVQTF